jgi:sulfopyruvate decarboxylase TPP-binding subunit
MIILGVPFSGIQENLEIICTREDEAIAIAFGINISGGNSKVLMQNSGYGHCIDVFTSLVIPYCVDVDIEITTRREPEHHLPMSLIDKDIYYLIYEANRSYQNNIIQCK